MELETRGRDDLLTPATVARCLGITTSTLRTWRRLEIGPPWVQVGPQVVRYREGDLDAYLDAQLGPVGGGAA